MIPNSRSGGQSQLTRRSFSVRSLLRAGILCLLAAALSAGCVSKEHLEAQKVRGLNFQRLLLQEEKRANTLEAELAQKDKELDKLTAQLKETKETIASLESKNHDLTVELDALKEQGRQQPEQEPVPDSPSLSQVPDLSGDGPLANPSLSDPFMSEEELLKMLDAQTK